MIGRVIRSVYFRLLPRLKPRRTFGWIFSAIIWLIVLVYVGFGIYFGIEVYKVHSEDKTVKFAVKVYPFPAAVVNASFIWSKSYYQQLNYIRQFSEKTKQAFPDPVALRKQIVDQLVENKILETEAAKNKIKVSNKDVNDAYDKIVAQSGGPTEVKKVLTELYGMSEKDFKELVRQQVLKEKIQNELIMQVKASHILIKDEARANEIAARAKKGEDFAALAKQYSEDAKSKDAGGALDWLSRGQLVVDGKSIPEFDEAAFAANKGDVVGPVKTSIGFDIIKIEDKKGKVNQTYDAWFESVKKQAKIFYLIK